jgi:hypothetical protein
MVAEQYGDTVACASVDVDDGDELKKCFKITCLPTCLVWRSGDTNADAVSMRVEKYDPDALAEVLKTCGCH